MTCVSSLTSAPLHGYVTELALPVLSLSPAPPETLRLQGLSPNLRSSVNTDSRLVNVKYTNAKGQN